MFSKIEFDRSEARYHNYTEVDYGGGKFKTLEGFDYLIKSKKEPIYVVSKLFSYLADTSHFFGETGVCRYCHQDRDHVFYTHQVECINDKLLRQQDKNNSISFSDEEKDHSCPACSKKECDGTDICPECCGKMNCTDELCEWCSYDDAEFADSCDD